MTNVKVTDQDARRLEGLAALYEKRDAAAADDLMEELGRAAVVSPDDVEPSVVTMYSRVVCRDPSGRLRDIQLVYPRDADAEEGRISVLAPLGRALLGATAGDRLTVHAWGRTFEWVVESIDYQPEAAGDRHL